MLKLPLTVKKAYLITDALSIEYLTGVKISEGYLLYSNSPTIFTDARYFSAVKSQIESQGFTAKLYNGIDSIKKELKSQRIKSLYINYDVITLSEYSNLLDLNVKIFDASNALKLVRSVKSQTELDNITKACEIAQTALYSVINDLKKGVSENFIKDKLESKMLELGAESVSFETIVAFGKNSAVPHHQTGETKLEDNSVVLIDMGCKYKGYCSDITRTFFYGQPSEKFKDCYDAVLSANLTAIENITEGTTTFEADGFARNLLKERGLGEYFTHSLGHGVGLEIHEFPALSPKKKDYLENGMVFTIEPGVYFDGEFGIRIEDTVALDNGAVKRLYSDSKELLIVNK